MTPAVKKRDDTKCCKHREEQMLVAKENVQYIATSLQQPMRVIPPYHVSSSPNNVEVMSSSPNNVEYTFIRPHTMLR